MDLRQRTVFQFLLCAECQEIFILRGQEFRTVEREKRLSFAHHLAGVIDEEFLHPARDTQIDMGNPLFVVVHAPDGTNRGVEWEFLDYGGLDADEPLRGRSDHGEGLRWAIIMHGRRWLILRLPASGW